MPIRTRSHELESESIKKFESYIPSKWVFRKKDPDYGIDGEIEIFDDTGKTTGLFINVQIKSTDATDIKDCLQESFKVETLKYYSSLGYPVLIAKYSSKYDKFFYTWAHSKNRSPIQKGQQYVTVRFPEENLLSTEIFFRLKEDVVNFLNYKKHKLHSPFKLHLFVNHPSFSKPDLVQQFRQYAGKHEVHIEICEPEDKDAIGKIVINKEHVIISIGGDSASFTFSHHDTNEEILADLNISLAILLSQIGYDIFSAKLAGPVYKQSTFFNKPGLLKGLLECFYFTKEFDLVFKASKWAVNLKDNVDEVLIFSALLYHHYNKSSREEQILVEKLFLLLNQYYSKKHDKIRMASSHYNLGNFYISKKEYLKALHHYNKVRKLNPNYSERHYYWYELGGIFFDAGKIKCASQAYKKSLEIKEEHDARAKYADTLLYMGEYSGAVEEFERFAKIVTERPEPFWCLKLITIKEIIDKFGIKDGNRDIDSSHKIILKEESPTKEDFEKAIQLDPLNSLPWYELGHIYFHEKNFGKSFLAYLWTALCTDENLEAWTYAFFIAFSNFPKNEDTTALLGNIFMAAYERNGEKFISYLFDFITNRIMIGDEMKEGLKAYVLRMVEVLPKEKTFDLRIVDEHMVIRKFNL